MKKVFGWRTLLSLPLSLAWFYIILKSIPVLIGFSLVLLAIAIWMVPLFIFRDTYLHVFSLNPLKRSKKINYTDIDRVTIHAGDYHCKLTIHTKDAAAATTNSFLRYYDMEDLYKQIRNLNVPVTSTGVRAISWPS